MSIWCLIFTHPNQIVSVSVSHQIPQQKSQDSSVADPSFLLVDYPGYGDNGAAGFKMLGLPHKKKMLSKIGTTAKTGC